MMDILFYVAIGLGCFVAGFIALFLLLVFGPYCGPAPGNW